MRNLSTDAGTIDERDELDLAIETLKDLTPSASRADQVRGGATTQVRACYCGTL